MISSAADDDFLLAVDNEEIPFFIYRAHIASMEPSTPHGFRRRFRLLPVTQHHNVTTRDNFANAFSVVRHVFVVRVYDADLDAGNREAGHGLAGVFLLAFPLESKLHPGEGEGRRRFRESIAGAARTAHLFFDLAHKRAG